MAQKSCKAAENICGRPLASLYSGPDRPPQWLFGAPEPSGASLQATRGRDRWRADPGFMHPRASSRVPIPRSSFASCIARGTVTADTLVWTEGMANWQRAGEIPGLLSGASGPPVIAAFGRASAERRRVRRRAAFDRPADCGASLAGRVLYCHRISCSSSPRRGPARVFYRWAVVPSSGAGAAQSGIHRPGRRSLVGVRRCMGLSGYAGGLR